MIKISAPLVDRQTGDIIPAADHNDVKAYIEDASYRTNTLALQIQGTEVISSSCAVKPSKIIIPSGSMSFYDSTGLVEIAKLDENGNFYILGGLGQL